MSEFTSSIQRSADVIVIGSGFGGAVAACRLAQAGRKVYILERGREYPGGSRSFEAVEKEDKTLDYGHFQIDRGTGMNVIRGIGVGGGSLHYFGVRLRTPSAVFNGPRWPKKITREIMDPYYDVAGEMLKASALKDNPKYGIPPRSTAFLEATQKCASCRGEPKFVPVAVNTGIRTVPTPGGIPQTPCIFCGECLMGCPKSETFEGDVNARALLTLNYLAVAKHHGAQIFASHFVSHIEKSKNGFDVHYINYSGDGPQGIHIMRAKQVVLGAGTLGSTEILLKSKAGLEFNNFMLGKHFSGNGDFIAKAIRTTHDLKPSYGPAITVGSDFSSKKNGIYIEDLGSFPFFESVIKMDRKIPDNINQHRMGYLGMGSDAGNGVLSLQGEKISRIHLTWDGKDSLPLYNEIISAMTEISQNLGGEFQNPHNYDPETGEGLITAHPLGGCVMADDAKKGVVSPEGEVYGVPGLFVVDGAIVPSALVVNPSYTITALAERVVFWMLHRREMRPGDNKTPVN